LEHVRAPAAADQIVTLRGIEEIQNVNALAPGQRLAFGKKGLTVVYGDNGSGKSGYARILKKACRARSPKNDDILPNIYSNAGGLTRAKVDFAVGGQNRSTIWESAKPSDELLSFVSVFDSRTANIHVDATNDVAYTPFPLKILADLAQLCQQIKKQIGSDIAGLEKQTPESINSPTVRSDTNVGKLIAGLSATTSVEQIEALAKLDDIEKARLAALKSDFAQDPIKAARALQHTKTRVSTNLEALTVLQEAVSDAAFSQLQGLYIAQRTTSEAASSAAADLFANEPIPNIGSDAWRILWAAARAYSESEAYPANSFPNTDDGAKCVLCQQDLSGSAGERMRRFDSFVRDETRKKADEAQAAYNNAATALRAANIAGQNASTILGSMRADIADDALADDVRRAVVSARWRLRAIARTHKLDSRPPLPTLVTIPTDRITAAEQALDHRISGLLATDEAAERKALIAEYHDLLDREALAVVKDDVIAEVARRKQIAALKEAQKDTSTNSVTALSGRLAERLVTGTLRAEFAKEVAKLGIGGLGIELRKEEIRAGVPLFRVSLIRRPQAKVGEVLSEGEHRCVALAAFMAELVTTESKSTVVFDDPVSSLDHVHRQEVAERLAEESLKRQVVVFTHDIAFLFLLDQACRDKGVDDVGYRSITRGQDSAGFCQPDPPARAQPVDRVIEGMQKQLDNERVHYEQGRMAEWEKTVDALQKRLRETWERAVEDVVGAVVKRLSQKVDTAGLAKLTAITLEDCEEMRKAYGRCSTLLHSQSEGLNLPPPPPQRLDEEIDALRKWVASIAAKQGKITPI
jgi:energy-coupling factor transporter ATP-binding protein EcfA2